MDRLYRQSGVEERFIEPSLHLYQLLQTFNCQTDLDQEIGEGEEIPGMTGWKAVETPGHAQSHIALYREADGVMIGGDHIIGHVSSNALIEPPYPGERERAEPLIQYRESLKKCLDMDITLVLAGHGEEVTDTHSLIEERLNKQEERALVLKELLAAGGPMTCFDLCKKLFPSKYMEQLPLTLSETLGHLDLLEAWGMVKKEEKDGVYYYGLGN
jgi:glyoxylase-like metal-dependent hydrolase (beta-lactamase superfamily II)